MTQSLPDTRRTTPESAAPESRRATLYEPPRPVVPLHKHDAVSLRTYYKNAGIASKLHKVTLHKNLAEQRKKFRDTRAAVKIQRGLRLMRTLKLGGAPSNPAADSALLGVALTADAMRGGRVNDDRTGRVLKRISVNDKRRESHVGEEVDPRIQALLNEADFDASTFCNAEVAEMMRADFEKDRAVEREAWQEMSDWQMQVDTKAIERRLKLLRKKPSREAVAVARTSYLISRPATASAGGSGARAARSLRRPSSAPVRRRGIRDLRAALHMVIACGRLTRHRCAAYELEDLGQQPFFITCGALSAVRSSRKALSSTAGLV